MHEEKYSTKSEDHMKSTCIAIYTYTHTRSSTKIMPWQTDTCTNRIVSTSRKRVNTYITNNTKCDYGLRTSLAKEVNWDRCRLSQFYQTFRPNLGPSSVVDQRYRAW